MITYKQKSDTIGVFASSLCLIHCVSTPLLFIAQAHAACCDVDAPSWWKSLDYIFLAVSFIAVYWSAKSTSKQWIKPAMWITWALLSFIILNEKGQWLALPEYAIYIPSLGLVFLHVYNLKFCQCKEEECCVN